MKIATTLLALSMTFACGPAEPTPTTPTEPAPTDPAPTATGTPSANGISAADCAAQGGKVVGDIGDGAIHRPDYKCPDSGAAPLGPIAPDPGGSVAIEGSVCCK